MTSAGFKILGENHPICPVFLEDAKLASTMAEKMLSNFKLFPPLFLKKFKSITK
jgi:7-keto-8-aminopelargonate synthetase-like enzyme